MFTGADDFFENIIMWRKVWIGGALRSGKTCLAVGIADELIRRGIIDGVWTNFPCALPATKTGLKRCAVIFDEPHLFVDSRSTRGIHTVYGSWAGKDQTVWLLPSVDPPDIRLRDVSVMRIGSLVLGPEVWFFEWISKATNLQGQLQRSKGFTFLPKRYFNLYDTFWRPQSDGGLADHIEEMNRKMGVKVFGETRLDRKGVA